mgnify:CR=1 FL=1|jgi:hypothetical protein
MLLLNFGRWDSAAGKIFIRERLYLHGYKWTFLVRTKFRYLKTIYE